ncbi:MAG: NAD-dependent epimerase/dehydratase family protein [Planctomycetia bacterium]
MEASIRMSMSGRRGIPTAVDCLVTGATGLVGNNVVRLLLNRGRTARALVRPNRGGDDPALAGLPIETARGTLDDEYSLQSAIDGASFVVHSAAMVHCGWRHLDEMHRVNVVGTELVARCARRAGARMIHVSSVDAIGLRADGEPADEETPPGGMPECPYVVTKREAEAAVLAEVDRGLDAVIVNPVFMLGPWDWKPSSGRMLVEVASGKGLFAPPGGNDFVDVRDVAAGILAAMDRGRTGRRYILGGHPLSYLEAWKVFARTGGRIQPLGAAGPIVLRVVGFFGDLAGMASRREPPVNSAAVTMSMLPHHFSSRRARSELGYSFRPFEDTVQDAFEWFVAHGYARPVRERTVLVR